MEIIKHANCVVLELNKFSKIEELISFFKIKSNQSKHVIINLLKSAIKQDILIFTLLPFYLNWQKRNKSFILVSNIRKELLNDMISITSLEEAFDFFHMEELTRSI